MVLPDLHDAKIVQNDHVSTYRSELHCNKRPHKGFCDGISIIHVIPVYRKIAGTCPMFVIAMKAGF